MDLKTDINDIENSSLEQLASLIDSNNTTNALLASNELERRKRLDKHKLDIELIEIQAKAMKTSNAITAICTIAGTIAGAILAVLMQWYLKQ